MFKVVKNILQFIKLLFLLYILANPYQFIQAANPSIGTITNYRPTFLPVLNQQGRLQIVIRLFNQDQQLHTLLVEPYTLTTSRSHFSNVTFRKSPSPGNLPGYFTWKEI